MSIPIVENLRQVNWENISESNQRLSALQDLENRLALQENRDACEIRFKQGQIEPGFMGEYIGQENCININPELVSNNEPYYAVETLFHESRHAYQAHISQFPEEAENPDQAKEWQMSEEGGYLGHRQFGYNLYRWQPVEKDANEVARQRTDELYEQDFGDTKGYPQYKAEQEQLTSDDVFRAEQQYGKDCEQLAREELINHYQQVQAQLISEEVSSQDQQTVDNPSSLPPSESPELASGASESEDQGYSYGYGC